MQAISIGKGDSGYLTGEELQTKLYSIKRNKIFFFKKETKKEIRFLTELELKASKLSKLPIREIHNLRLLDDLTSKSFEIGMSRVVVDVVIPVLDGVELDDECVGEAVLCISN